MRVLITCPPMLGQIEDFKPLFSRKGIELVTPKVVQILSEEELIQLVPQVDGWIIGDDPATERVFAAGRQGHLKAAVKWGVGVDNVDFNACKQLGIPVTNTPFMFGAEVADIAVNYVIGLARQTFWVDREVRKGNWPKPAGISLSGKQVALIGFGDIGKATASRLQALGMHIRVYDPFAPHTLSDETNYRFSAFPEQLEEADFVVVTASLTPGSRHLLNAQSIGLMKKGVRIVNVSRGPIIEERALIEALQAGQVHSAALDVFEVEPLPADSPLRQFEYCIFGTHNGSNTVDAMHRASQQAITYLFNFLQVPLREEDWSN
ncbi:MAG: phosphoglycerate dehydrogenase [Saprospirales bacterium]|nr:phosphoglycerate dehydrogenase [Saprospirales bacterium]